MGTRPPPPPMVLPGQVDTIQYVCSGLQAQPSVDDVWVCVQCGGDTVQKT